MSVRTSGSNSPSWSNLRGQPPGFLGIPSAHPLDRFYTGPFDHRLIASFSLSISLDQVPVRSSSYITPLFKRCTCFLRLDNFEQPEVTSANRLRRASPYPTGTTCRPQGLHPHHAEANTSLDSVRFSCSPRLDREAIASIPRSWQNDLALAAIPSLEGSSTVPYRCGTLINTTE